MTDESAEMAATQPETTAPVDAAPRPRRCYRRPQPKVEVAASDAVPAPTEVQAPAEAAKKKSSNATDAVSL